MNLRGISCVMVRNHEGISPPLGLRLNSPRPSLCRKPPQVHRACPQAPGALSQGEVGSDFQHFGHCRPASETSCLLCSHLPGSLKSMTAAFLPLGFPAGAVKSQLWKGLKHISCSLRHAKHLQLPETGTAVQCSHTQVLWDRAERG